MKIAIYLVLTFTAIVSCHKKEPFIDNSPYWGELSLLKNNMKWVGKPFAEKDLLKGFGLELDSLDIFGVRRESISFTKIPYKTGTFALNNTIPQNDDSLIGAGYFIVDDDVSLGNYLVLESDSSSFITITSYDSLSNEIKGTFDATFIVEQKPDASYPDTVRFRNGVFHTKLIR
jgi:hypothetical protein